MAAPDNDFAAAKSVPFSEIPVVDVGDLIAGKEPDRVARAIHDAATRVGFFYLANHGISEDLASQAFAASESFFALPEEQKSTIAIDTTQRGWMRTGMATMDGAATYDLKEVFFWGYDIGSDHPDIVAGRPRSWP